MSKKLQNPENGDNSKETHITHCLNCGTEVAGKFCHECGQQVMDASPTVGNFIMEYLNNAFIWDPQCLRTLWTLVRRPGQLTKEFLAGRIHSQENPLKLNMFILFIFITLFMIFSGEEGANRSVDSMVTNKMLFPTWQLESYKEDSAYVEKMKSSPRDTVLMYAPLSVERDHPDVLDKISVIDDTHGQSLDKWEATVPRVLIEDKILIPNEEGYYFFNTDEEVIADGQREFQQVFYTLVSIGTTYFPMIMLLTAPFLALALALMHVRRKQPLINHFIYSLHYTAFVEILILLIYVIYLTTGASMDMLQWILRIGATIYLVLAYHKVYEPKSWFKSILKALVTYMIYLINCAILAIIVFVIACAIVFL